MQQDAEIKYFILIILLTLISHLSPIFPFIFPEMSNIFMTYIAKIIIIASRYTDWATYLVRQLY
jgi:hypothetical protein